MLLRVPGHLHAENVLARVAAQQCPFRLLSGEEVALERHLAATAERFGSVVAHEDATARARPLVPPSELAAPTPYVVPSPQVSCGPGEWPDVASWAADQRGSAHAPRAPAGGAQASSSDAPADETWDSLYALGADEPSRLPNMAVAPVPSETAPDQWRDWYVNSMNRPY